MSQRIVIVCDQASKVGGHARVAVESAAGLARTGQEIFYFASRGPVDPELTDAGVNVILTDQPDALDEANPIYGAFRGIWNFKAKKLLSELIRSNGSSSLLFHVHGWTKSLSPSVLSEIIAAGVPVVCTIHDFFSVCPNGEFFNFQSESICQLSPMSRKCICSNCDSRSYYHKLWRLARQFTMIHLAKFPSAITNYIYTSEFSKGIISKYLPDNARYHYLPNPVHISKKQQVSAWQNKSFIYVGRLAAEKGVLPAAKLFHRLRLPFEVAGSGELGEQVREANPDAVLHGWLDSKGLSSLFERARVLVFPSLWYETYGLTVYEALASGIPVIGTRESAAVEAIMDGRSGRLFSWNKPGEFEKTILSAGDSAAVEQWSNFAYSSYWKNPVTIDLHVAMLVEVYGRVRGRRA
jgi:glycosyltransferase involved in cell wall biosynthesis